MDTPQELRDFFNGFKRPEGVFVFSLPEILYPLSAEELYKRLCYTARIVSDHYIFGNGLPIALYPHFTKAVIHGEKNFLGERMSIWIEPDIFKAEEDFILAKVDNAYLIDNPAFSIVFASTDPTIVHNISFLTPEIKSGIYKIAVDERAKDREQNSSVVRDNANKVTTGKLDNRRVAKRKAKKSKKQEDKKVYFLQASPDGLIKIGYTSNLDSRISSIRSDSPSEIRLLASVDGTRELEAELHEEFASYNQHGEWFKPSREILQYVVNKLTEEP